MKFPWIQIVIFLGCVALICVLVPVLGIPIPAWVVSVFWILVVCCGIIFAIKFLQSQG